MHNNFQMSARRSAQARHALFGWLVVAVLVGVGIALAVHFNLTTWHAWQALPGKVLQQARGEPMPFVMGGILLLVFFAIAIKLIVDTVSLLRFGAASLQLDPEPGSIGGHLGGAIRLGYRIQPADKVTVTAVCWRHYVRRSGGKREHTRERFWSDEVRPDTAQQFGQLQLRFTFDVPENAFPTGKHGEDSYRWEVMLRIDRKGRDVVRSFAIPVTDGEPRFAARPMRSDQVVADGEMTPGMEIVDTPGRLRIRGLPGRNRGMHFLLSAFGLGFGGVGVFLGYDVALDNWLDVFGPSQDTFKLVFGLIFAVMSSFMALVFAGIGLLLLAVAISGARNRRELVVSNDRLETGNRGKQSVMPLVEVEHFEISESGSMGTNTVHDVHAIGNDGKRLAVLEAVPGRLAAKRIIALLEQHTSKPVRDVGKSRRRIARRTRERMSALHRKQES